MPLSRQMRRRLAQTRLPLLVICLTAYFVYQAAQGERGVLAWMKLREQIRAAEAALADTTAEREALERRVALLSPQTLDRDMLEERARIMLNFAHPDDLVILLNDPPAAAPTD